MKRIVIKRRRREGGEGSGGVQERERERERHWLRERTIETLVDDERE